jgi:hypothetical protein
LQEELNQGKPIPIPRYLFVNKKGEIAFEHAARPSAIRLLMEQLKKVME